LSEGLLVLTNDGILLEKLTHPRFGTSKEYLVGLREKLPKGFIDELKQGFVLDDYKLNPVSVKQITYTDPIYHKYQFLNLESSYIWYLFTLSEGRNNEIRKLCELQNQKVFRLIRVKQGNFEVTKDLFNKKLLDRVKYS
jgi:pseudouridine synthase